MIIMQKVIAWNKRMIPFKLPFQKTARDDWAVF
jgi:hypothetical protein